MPTIKSALTLDGINYLEALKVGPHEDGFHSPREIIKALQEYNEEFNIYNTQIIIGDTPVDFTNLDTPLPNDPNLEIAVWIRDPEIAQALSFLDYIIKEQRGADYFHKFLREMPKKYKADREFVLTVVRENGDALRHASGALQNDRGIVLAAVAQNSYALQHASEELRKDRGFVLAAARQNPMVLNFVDPNIRTEVRERLAGEQAESVACLLRAYQKYAAKVSSGASSSSEGSAPRPAAEAATSSLPAS
jgi:hypothetical protein